MSLQDVLNLTNITEKSDDNPPEDDYDNNDISSTVNYTMITFISIIITLNIPSIIVLLFTNVKASNFVSVHILSLSLTDCGVGLSFFFVILTRTFNYWDCWTRLFIFNAMNMASTTQVAAICLDRVLLFHNLKWKSVTKNYSLVLKVILVTFLITCVITLIPFLAFTQPHDISICSVEHLFEDGIEDLHLYVGIINSCLELFVILCTATVIRFLWKHKLSKQRVNPHITNPSHSISMVKETRAMVTLCIVVVLFIILTTPINVMICFQGIIGEVYQQDIILPFAAISCLNSALNPIVFSFRNPEMKKAFKTLWHKMRCW